MNQGNGRGRPPGWHPQYIALDNQLPKYCNVLLGLYHAE